MISVRVFREFSVEIIFVWVLHRLTYLDFSTFQRNVPSVSSAEECT